MGRHRQYKQAGGHVRVFMAAMFGPELEFITHNSTVTFLFYLLSPMRLCFPVLTGHSLHPGQVFVFSFFRHGETRNGTCH